MGDFLFFLFGGAVIMIVFYVIDWPVLFGDASHAGEIMRFASLLALSLLLCSCGDFELTDKQDEVVLKKSDLKTYILVNRQDLEQLKSDASLGKSVGRYLHYRVGIRTFRLDTSTGQNCLMLTSEVDWKTPDAQASACSDAGGPGTAALNVRVLDPLARQ